jgi:hypothetical protein
MPKQCPQLEVYQQRAGNGDYAKWCKFDLRKVIVREFARVVVANTNQKDLTR